MVFPNMNAELLSTPGQSPPRRRKRFLLLILAVAMFLLCLGFFFAWQHFFGSKVIDSVTVNPPPPSTRESIPVPMVQIADVTSAAGIQFKHFNGASGKKLLAETMGGGVCVFDFDGDGLQDILFVNGCSWPGQKGPESSSCLTLYRNKGDGTFEDVTEAAGLTATMYCMGACAGDIDNDGFPDLFITAIGGCKLFRNVAGPDGKRRFVDSTKGSGIACTAPWPIGLSAEEFL